MPKTNNKKLAAITLLPLSILSFSLFSHAHHSPAAYDTEQNVTIEGTVTSYSFRNPHVYMTVDVADAGGSVTSMEIEAGASSVIQPLGFTRDAVRVGDRVTIAGSPSHRRPETHMMGRELYKEDGTYYPLHIQARRSYQVQAAVADSIEGTWIAETGDFYAYLNANRTQWTLTEKGRDFLNNIDPEATPQKDCIPLASPNLMLYPVARTITIHDDRVVLDIDWLEAERTIWLDGRSHPPAEQSFLLGHSTGYWDGNDLVIDTTNYSAHTMGISLLLPGSTGKHLIERLSLDEDGRGITYSGEVTDPEYLTGPATFSGHWQFRPDMEHSDEACDIDVATRFLEE